MSTEELAAQKAASRAKLRFVRIRYDGQSCICEPREVSDMLVGCDGATVEDVWMTQAQYDKLPEFEGW